MNCNMFLGFVQLALLVLMSRGSLKVWSPLAGMFAEHLVCGCDILHPYLSTADGETLT